VPGASGNPTELATRLTVLEVEIWVKQQSYVRLGLWVKKPSLKCHPLPLKNYHDFSKKNE